jgi:murein DD-endopeptidase MepM/ murein hydrolase activator NlpD
VEPLNLHIRKSGKSNKGFYIALGVCLIAVGVAAWTTYDSVVNYAAPQSEKTESQTNKVNNAVSGVYVPDSSAPASGKAPAASKPAKSSAPASSSRRPAPSSAASKAPAKQADTKPQQYAYPVGNATVLQKFSENPVYSKTTEDWRAHPALDLSAKAGETVGAIADGTVKKVYKDDQLGSTVIVTHGDLEAWYCGLNQISVKEGEEVRQSQKLGTVGAVPIEQKSGSHLHFALKKGGKYVDPLTVLS